ncbi:DUF2125 domain-containing protein [Rhodalgimonas zhirmunskyi]|uniref:DUF2125 domain-containing protein n=1 Tax=Rhodalgimonas zhirmunskyi TaxID=2964767 RepID=A0AAJ1U6A0_9RHOB|nr:DUF2125 domain-containing protein [Rhodoalgimonas zhirmunskyi]MDQ2093794.1 DUF2125 domain-containing protein [Rhodoalgimonas zhirmunskyi]
MKRLLAVIVIAAALWSGYWYIAQRGARAGIESWFDARRAEGWQAEYKELATQGFPNRIDTTLTDPVLADPESGLAWTAPMFKLFALSYQPNHIIAVWPETQVLSTPTARYEISSADMRASLVMQPAPQLPLERANLISDALAIEGPGGTTTMEGLQIAILRQEGGESYHLGLNADGYAPPLPRGLTLRTGGTLPQKLSSLRADLELGFDKPIDLTALSEARPQPRRIKVTLAEAKWGQLELALAGTLDIDDLGRPKGQITIKARNWRDMLELARQMDLLPAEWLNPVEQALGLAAQLNGNTRTLDLPLTFNRTTISLGPIPIGPAPIIRLR